MAQWVARLTRHWSVLGSNPIKGSLVSFSTKLYPWCLVLVGSRNWFKCDFKINKLRALLKIDMSYPLFKFHQNPNQIPSLQLLQRIKEVLWVIWKNHIKQCLLWQLLGKLLYNWLTVTEAKLTHYKTKQNMYDSIYWLSFELLSYTKML